MKKIIGTFSLLFLLFSFTILDKGKVYESENYSINIPDTWRFTLEEGNLNIISENHSAEILVSEFHNGQFSMNMTAKIMVDMHNPKDNPENVSQRKRGKYTEFEYQYVDPKENVVWLTKIIRNEKDIYQLSLNCKQNLWSGSNKEALKETFDSFKIKNK